MPDIEPFSPRGMFHEGWSAEVDDYAIVCGWALGGKLFIVCLLYTSDAADE